MKKIVIILFSILYLSTATGVELYYSSIDSLFGDGQIHCANFGMVQNNQQHNCCCKDSVKVNKLVKSGISRSQKIHLKKGQFKQEWDTSKRTYLTCIYYEIVKSEARLYRLGDFLPIYIRFRNLRI